MLVVTGSGDSDGAGSGRPGELVEAVLLRVGRDKKVVHPLDAVLQLLARELVQVDCSLLGSTHVLHGSLVDGREGAEGAPDRATRARTSATRLGSGVAGVKL